MFASAGYFRSAICPFYLHGLCHRPYCHFKHAKPVKDNNIITSSRAKIYDIPPSSGINKGEPKEKKNLESEDDTLKESKLPLSHLLREDSSPEIRDVEREERKETVKAELTDITELLHDSLGPGDVLEHSNLDDCQKPVEKKSKKVKNEKVTKSIGEGTKCSLKMANVDFFSSSTAKTNSKKKEKTAGSKGIKRKNSESKKDIKKASSMTSPVENQSKRLKLSLDEKLPSIVKRNSPSKSSAPLVLSPPTESISKCAPVTLKRTASGLIDYIPENCTETTGHGSVKKRIAHAEDAEYAQRTISSGHSARIFPKKPSFVSPVLSGDTMTCNKVEPKTLDIAKSEEKTPSYSSEEGLYLGKKRLAHPSNFYKKEANKSTLKRPKIPIEYGAKVPQNVRQRYLDKLIDELIPKCNEEQEAFDMALVEEAAIYERSSRRQIYMNLCVNAIKRFRDLPPPTTDQSFDRQINDPHTTAGTTTSSLTQLSKQINNKAPIRPSAASLAMTGKKHSSLLQAKLAQGINRNTKQTPPVLTEEIFYEHLLGYLASEDDLWENNYPRSTPGKPGIANMKMKSKEPSETETKRICSRCGKQFLMDEEGEYLRKDECHYHWGKIRRVRGKGEISMHFSCCQGEAGSLGCCACKLHVSNFVKVPSGYVTTDDSRLPPDEKAVFSLDCEMCYTSQGLELTRVSVVNFDLKEVYDTFVKPGRPIIDYNTRFSGVTEVHLRHVKVTLKDVQNDLLKMFGKGTILMGHSLESDLKALKMIHNKVVDTALVFPHKMGLPYKRALRNLMADHLQKIIQDSEGGHDSAEDSSACMELMRWRVMEDIQKKARKKHY